MQILQKHPKLSASSLGYRDRSDLPTQFIVLHSLFSCHPGSLLLTHISLYQNLPLSCALAHQNATRTPFFTVASGLLIAKPHRMCPPFLVVLAYCPLLPDTVIPVSRLHTPGLPPFHRILVLYSPWKQYVSVPRAPCLL